MISEPLRSHDESDLERQATTQRMATDRNSPWNIDKVEKVDKVDKQVGQNNESSARVFAKPMGFVRKITRKLSCREGSARPVVNVKARQMSNRDRSDSFDGVVFSHPGGVNKKDANKKHYASAKFNAPAYQSSPTNFSAYHAPGMYQVFAWSESHSPAGHFGTAMMTAPFKWGGGSPS